MKIRTMLLALVTAVLLCSTFAFVAVANADLELSASSVSCMPGETVTVTVNIDQNPGIYYLSIYLNYDTEALELISVQNETTILLTAGYAYIWTAGGTNNYTGTGALATLTFAVKEDAPDGAYEIGIWAEYCECYNIDEDSVTIAFDKGVIEVCSHSKTTTVSDRLPTCTEAGENIIYCADCGIELSRESVAPLGHKPDDWTVKTEPTCTKEGTKIKVCSVCGDTVDTGSIPANGHTAGDWTVQVEATCTAGGVNVKRCTVCNTIVETVSTPIIAHNYNSGEITGAPTCTKEGVLTFTCEACKHSYTESIAKIAHSYDALGICSVCNTKSALFISTGAVRAKHDELVTVELTLDRNAGAFYLSLLVDYDKDALELVSVENSGMFSMTTGIMYVFTASNKDVTETGTLVTFTFAVKETAKANVTYPINVTVYECNNAAEASVDAVAGNGSVFVYDFIYGDANGDGEISGQDATRLLRYLANYNPITGESTLTIEGGADCNGDGQISGQDATRLLRYLANYNPIAGESSVTLGPV